MPGFGGASTSHGAMGQSGAGYAFNDGLGLSTGKTWYGNAAFGPAGGMAQGYGTGNGSGVLSNLRALDGSPYGIPQPTSGLAALPRPAAPVVRPAVRPPVQPPRINPPPVQVQPPPQGLSYRYNNVLPPGYNYSNYMTNPTQRPTPYSGPLQGSTHYKNNTGNSWSVGGVGGSVHGRTF